MIIFDSNIWIAFFDADDAIHTRAFTIVEPYDNSTDIALLDCIIVEVCTVLKNHNKFHIAEQFLDFIDEHDIKIIYTGLYLKSFIKAFRTSGRNKLSFVDTSLLALAKEGNTILTLDKALNKQLKSLHK